VKPAPFHYIAARTIQEAVDALASCDGDAKPLAGGQSLVPLMNLRLARPSMLVDLNEIDGLGYIRLDGDALAVGALTRHHDLATSDLARRHRPMLGCAAALIGYPAIRFRGTAGGSLAHADPVSELPCVAVALEAELVARGSRGQRVIPAGDFFTGYLGTVLEPDEILIEIRFPLRPAVTGGAFREFARKRGDFAVTAVAVEAELAGDEIGGLRVGIAGAGDRPIRMKQLEAALAEARPDPDAIDSAIAEAVAALRPPSDVHGSAEYRRHCIATLIRRALGHALEVSAR